LRGDLKGVPADAPVVIFTHRPLFDLAPQWDWATKDGAKAIDLLGHYKHVTVFYGHIHQEHHFTTGEIAHHASKSLIFPLPAPMSVPKKAPVAWDPEHPRRGLGFREITAAGPTGELPPLEARMEGGTKCPPASSSQEASRWRCRSGRPPRRRPSPPSASSRSPPRSSSSRRRRSSSRSASRWSS